MGFQAVFNNGSFNEGGRFYGGWWQNFPSDYRQFITINGHTTWEYDYSSLHPAMLDLRFGRARRVDRTESRVGETERFANALGDEPAHHLDHALPSSASIIVATEVNGLVIESISKIVSGAPSLR
jgi:hypothetical protein